MMANRCPDHFGVGVAARVHPAGGGLYLLLGVHGRDGVVELVDDRL